MFVIPAVIAVIALTLLWFLSHLAKAFMEGVREGVAAATIAQNTPSVAEAGAETPDYKRMEIPAVWRRQQPQFIQANTIEGNFEVIA